MAGRSKTAGRMKDGRTDGRGDEEGNVLDKFICIGPPSPFQAEIQLIGFPGIITRVRVHSLVFFFFFFLLSSFFLVIEWQKKDERKDRQEKVHRLIQFCFLCNTGIHLLSHLFGAFNTTFLSHFAFMLLHKPFLPSGSLSNGSYRASSLLTFFLFLPPPLLIYFCLSLFFPYGNYAY